MSTLGDWTMSVLNLKEPQTIGELHRLAVIYGYYRNLFRNLAKLAGTLNEVNKTDGNAYKSKLIITERWSPACQEFFDEIKKRLTSAPIQVHSWSDSSYILYTATPCKAFRAVLCQVWTAEYYPTPEPEEKSLAFVTLGGENWESDLQLHLLQCLQQSQSSREQKPQ